MCECACVSVCVCVYHWNIAHLISSVESIAFRYRQKQLRTKPILRSRPFSCVPVCMYLCVCVSTHLLSELAEGWRGANAVYPGERSASVRRSQRLSPSVRRPAAPRAASNSERGSLPELKSKRRVYPPTLHAKLISKRCSPLELKIKAASLAYYTQR